MSSRQHAIVVILGIAIVLGGGGGLLVWPAWKEIRADQTRIRSLNDKMAGLSGQAEEVERLAVALGAAQDRVRHGFREIPDAPDVASMMRRLSFPVDGVTVLDQTFTAGSPNEVLPQEEQRRAMGMPLSVDIRATFDSVFALIRAAESMDRLVRITSVHMVCDRDETAGSEPIIAATIGFEAIFETEPIEEGS